MRAVASPPTLLFKTAYPLHAAGQTSYYSLAARACPRELLNLTEIGRYLNVSAERARQVAADDPSFSAPLSEKPRRWSRAKVERWAERHWWGTRPWRNRP